MNKRKIATIALALMLTTSAIVATTNNREFSRMRVVDVEERKEVDEEQQITMSIEEEIKPLTTIIPSRTIIIQRNDKPENIVTFNGIAYLYKRKINIVATYYTNSIEDCGKTDGITASGVKASRGTIAVPKNIKFGTEIIIEDQSGNMQKYIAQDRGSAIKWIDKETMKIDVFVPNATRKQLLKMGVKRYTGYIIENIYETP